MLFSLALLNHERRNFDIERRKHNIERRNRLNFLRSCRMVASHKSQKNL